MPVGPQYRLAAKLARRGVPIAIDLYRRWQHLTPEQRERYLKLAKQYADRAGGAAREIQQRAPRRTRRSN